MNEKVLLRGEVFLEFTDSNVVCVRLDNGGSVAVYRDELYRITHSNTTPEKEAIEAERTYKSEDRS